MFILFFIIASQSFLQISLFLEDLKIILLLLGFFGIGLSFCFARESSLDIFVYACSNPLKKW